MVTRHHRARPGHHPRATWPGTCPSPARWRPDERAHEHSLLRRATTPSEPARVAAHQFRRPTGGTGHCPCASSSGAPDLEVQVGVGVGIGVARRHTPGYGLGGHMAHVGPKSRPRASRGSTGRTGCTTRRTYNRDGPAAFRLLRHLGGPIGTWTEADVCGTGPWGTRRAARHAAHACLPARVA